MLTVFHVVFFHDFKQLHDDGTAGWGAHAVYFEASVLDGLDRAGDDFVVLNVVQRQGAISLPDKIDNVLCCFVLVERLFFLV